LKPHIAESPVPEVARKDVPGSVDPTIRSEFLTKSIEDIQATIRALDVKASGLLVVLVVPLTATDKLGDALRALHRLSPWHMWPLTACWGLSLLFALLTLWAIANPADRIPAEDQPAGTYYGASLFSLHIGDFTPWPWTKSRYSVSSWLARCPSVPEDVVKELAFEQMKLTYIRDVKILRLRWALSLLALGLVLLAIGVLRYSDI
jgi:hypothetical protein